MICFEVCEALESDHSGYTGPLSALSHVETPWSLPRSPRQQLSLMKKHMVVQTQENWVLSLTDKRLV